MVLSACVHTQLAEIERARRSLQSAPSSNLIVATNEPAIKASSSPRVYLTPVVPLLLERTAG